LGMKIKRGVNRNMKKLLAVLCALLCLTSTAFAEITIIRQPETQTAEPGGNVSFSMEAKGVGGSGITWHFVNGETGEDVTGRKLSARFPGLKVRNPNTLNISLQNVTEEMHGWTVYCHMGPKNGGVDSEKVQLLIAGKESAESSASLSPDVENEARAEEQEEQPTTPAETQSETEASLSAGDAAAVSSDSGNTACPQIQGFDPDSKSYQFLQLGTYFYEEDGTKAPLLWRVLYREGNKLTLFTEYIIDTHQMYETEVYYGRNDKNKYKKHFNDPYEELGIYSWLNGEAAGTILSETDFSAAIIPHKVKETYKNASDEENVPEWPDEGAVPADRVVDREKYPYGQDLFYIMTYGDMKKARYGFPATSFGDAIEQEGEIAVPEAGRRKTWATPYARNKIQYPEWKQKLRLTVMSEYNGTSPYWAIKRRKNYYMAGIVGGNGHLSWRSMDSVQIGVRPAMRLDLSLLQVTGGSGTKEDPWIMEMNE